MLDPSTRGGRGAAPGRGSRAADLVAKGFPLWDPDVTADAEAHRQAAAATLRRLSLSGTVALTVCSRAHLPLARVLAESLRERHPELPLVAIVADILPGNPVELAGATVVAPDELGVAAFRWLAFKYDAWELCCALKPLATAWAFDCGAERIVYLDSDVEVHGSLASLLEPLDRNDWVVTPHFRRLPPADEAPGTIPSLGDLTVTGLLNAGIYAVRHSPAVRRFLAEWTAATSGPGAFAGFWKGGRTEQQTFAWVLSCGGEVWRLADPAQNVAYWNLHERRLERVGDRFEIDGEPLATFHWSGFDPENDRRISRHDTRHRLDRNPHLAELAARYRRRLVDHGWTGEPVAWRWDTLPSGERIDERIRELAKCHERQLDRGDDPWSDSGERRLARAFLAPATGSGSLLPLLLADHWRNRDDLQRAFPEAERAPERFFAWYRRWGVAEHGYEIWIERFRPALPTGGVSAEDGSPGELYVASPLAVAAALWRGRADLRGRFLAPLGRDLESYAAWLAADGAEEHALPPEVARALRDPTARSAEDQLVVEVWSGESG